MPNLPITPREDDQGQDIAEYALIVAVIVILTIGAIHYFWSAINKLGQ
jgi:Flp pilus assembly pilin Flp